jgi:hypothetical protein
MKEIQKLNIDIHPILHHVKLMKEAVRIISDD